MTNDRTPLLTHTEQAEHATLVGQFAEDFEAQRQRNLLRVMIPGLLGLALLALPLAILVDVQSQDFASTAQDLIGLVGFGLAAIALRVGRPQVASYALFGGVCGVILYVLLSDTFFAVNSMLSLTNVPELMLLILPIGVAGLLLGPRAIILTTLATTAFTVIILTFTHHAADIAAALAQPAGPALYSIPLSVQIALGIFTFAAVTTLRRTQRDLYNMQTAFARERELERLKDLFLSGVNHELRTPIMAMQNYLGLAVELGTRGEIDRQRYILHRSAESLAHLTTLVDAVANARHIDDAVANIAVSPTAVRPLAESAVKIIADSGVNHPIAVAIPDDLIVRADQEFIRQIFINLLSNAAKYSEPGTPILISATIQSGKNAQAPMVAIAVRDYGLGVPPELRNMLFQRLVRLPRDVASTIKGTGLGLALCKAYVEAMGGTIWVESTGIVGEGSTFIFTLPSEKVPIPQRVAGQTS